MTFAVCLKRSTRRPATISAAPSSTITPTATRSPHDYGDENGQRWADVIDFLTMYPDARRHVTRLLGEIEAH